MKARATQTPDLSGSPAFLPHSWLRHPSDSPQGADTTGQQDQMLVGMGWAQVEALPP